MPQMRDVNATLDSTTGDSKNEAPSEVKKVPKKAKWHLGIRSQSKPQDIMNEVFKAMKANNMVIIYIFLTKIRGFRPMGQCYKFCTFCPCLKSKKGLFITYNFNLGQG